MEVRVSEQCEDIEGSKMSSVSVSVGECSVYESVQFSFMRLVRKCAHAAKSRVGARAHVGSGTEQRNR